MIPRSQLIIPYAIVALICLSAGCGRSRSGRYEAVITEKRRCRQLADGRCVDVTSMEGIMASPFMAASEGRKPARISYRTVHNQLTLTLKEDKSDITGNLVVTDNEHIQEFVIRTGSVGDDGKLHLKLTLKPDAQVGASAFGFSLSGGLTEMLFNLDQVEGKRELLVFRVTDSVNLLGGLINRASEESDKIAFKKV